MATNVSSTISTQNTWSTSIYMIGWYNISVQSQSNYSLNAGLNGSTVSLQRSFDNGTKWRDIKQYTTAAEEYGFEPEGALYRIGIKTGQYGTAAVDVRIGIEPGMTK